MIITQEDLKAAVIKYGFLPFFTSSIPGFSIDELTPQAVWDEYLGLGPWLWRDDIAKDKSCIYVPERWLGQDAVRGAYSISPQTSFQIITEKLMNGLHVGGNEVEKLLG